MPTDGQQAAGPPHDLLVASDAGAQPGEQVWELPSSDPGVLERLGAVLEDELEGYPVDGSDCGWEQGVGEGRRHLWYFGGAEGCVVPVGAHQQRLLKQDQLQISLPLLPQQQPTGLQSLQ